MTTKKAPKSKARSIPKPASVTQKDLDELRQSIGGLSATVAAIARHLRLENIKGVNLQ